MSTCRDLARRRRRDKLLLLGRPVTVRGAECEWAVRRIRTYHARGMTYVQMGRQTGVRDTVFRKIACYGRVYMKRDTYDMIVGLRFEEPDPNAWVDPSGSRRRVQALWAAGYPMPWLAERIGTSRFYLQKAMHGRSWTKGVEYRRALVIADLYEKFELQDPADLGIDLRASSFARTFARKRGYAVAKCWDPDTIDDPQAFPEWTGACGSDEGAWIHRRDGIPLCEPCRLARNEARLKPRAGQFSPELFRKVRNRAKYSQGQLEVAAGFAGGVVHHWESGRSRPRAKSLQAVLEVLGADLEDVIAKEESRGGSAAV